MGNVIQYLLFLGFGKVDGEFWLGNDHLHRLTQDKTTMLRVDLWDIYGQYWWAEYDTFFVDDEKSGYMVKFDGYHGNASDAMASYHQNMKFSTRDNDQVLHFSPVTSFAQRS